MKSDTFAVLKGK